MSVVDQIKNLFAKKPTDSELDSRLSLGMPDGAMGVTDLETLQQVSPAAQEDTSMAKLRAADSERGDLVTLPVLGARTVPEHQKLLFSLLGGSLLVLALIAFYS